MKVKVFMVLMLATAIMASACGKSDADLTKAVTNKLTTDGVTGVTATVKDGVATLTGEVADQTVKTKAEASAKAVDGVKSVTNSLTLRPLPVATPAAADPALTGKINEDLKKAGCTGASAASVNGVVTVVGEVPAAKYRECVQIVQQSGITGIKNELKQGK
ncbi:MAG: BON domain-containing protein [bacterium]|nr:BON domain-containing protein [bacterium]